MSIVKKKENWSFIETAFAFLIVVAMVYATRFFIVNGYLPSPFFQDTNDTFMDWYNTAYWSDRRGAYELWGSVYPPLSFLFLRLFSAPSCYADTSEIARHCDQIGIFALGGFVLLNTIILYFTYKKDHLSTAIPRAIALGFGMPMLFAWERGNLIVPCFTFFILGHGRLLKAGWIRWLCVAVSINFKPYLMLALVGRALRMQWRWLEGCGIAVLLIYTASYMVFGQGNPIELFNDIAIFSQGSDVIKLDSISYASTFNALVDILRAPLPIMLILGSRPIETMESVLPIAIRLGELGVLAVFAGAIWRPSAIPVYRLGALSVALLLTASNPGGYAEVFLFFFVFFEQWKGPGRIVALISTYALCVPCDYQIVGIAHQMKNSYLSGHTVGYDLGLTVGEFVRPALMLTLQYGLIAVSISDIIRGLPFIAGRRPPVNVQPGSAELNLVPSRPGGALYTPPPGTKTVAGRWNA